MSSRRFYLLSLFLLTLLSRGAAAFGPPEDLYELSAKKMIGSSRFIFLPVEWKYHAADDPAFAAAGLDDSEWEEVDTRFHSLPAGWSGVGWFRLRFRVDPDLEGRALSLLLDQVGAAEIYLDGELIHTLGKVDADPARTVRSKQRRPHLFVFDNRGVHVLAVRFCHHHPASAEAIAQPGGFRAAIGEANQRIVSYSQDLRTNRTYQALFPGIFASFAVLHLLLFFFYREAAENLWYALLTGSVAFLVFLFLHRYSTTDPEFFPFYERAFNTTWLLVSVFALSFVYGVFREARRRPLWGITALAGALFIPGLLWPRSVRPMILLLVLVAFLEMCRVVVKALRRGEPGARIVGLGILVLTAGFATGLLSSLEMVRSSITTVFLVPLYSMCFLVLSMSVYLSRRFAQTHRDLVEQLTQVRQLSEEKLRSERREREEEVERTRLEAEYRRKARELEEARQLQLSMLPERLPELPGLELAAGMRTATEVGGDYYDFDVASDGTLTIAIGDATGHGMRAGTMVTATKSLFNALEEPDADLPQTLTRFTRALKRMKLRQLSMALTLARFKNGRLVLAAAGMPPALVYRAESKTVETLLVEGAPLGSLTGYPYRQTELELHPGDTLLLMSDGFPERRNGSDELLGYEKATSAFLEVATAPPQRVIDGLVTAGEAWAGGEPAQDDMTFVVMKRSLS